MKAVEILKSVCYGWNDLGQMSVMKYEFDEECDFLSLFGEGYKVAKGRLEKDASYLAVFCEELYNAPSAEVELCDGTDNVFLYRIDDCKTAIRKYKEELEDGVPSIKALTRASGDKVAFTFVGKLEERTAVIARLDNILHEC